MATTAIQLSGLAHHLVDSGFLDEEQAVEAQTQASKEHIPFISYVVKNELVDSMAAAESAANEFGVPLFDLDAMDMEVAAVELVDESLILKHHALPLCKRANRLFVAVSDPTNLQALDEIKFHTDVTTEQILVDEAKLAVAISKIAESQDSVIADLGNADLDGLEITGGDEAPAEDDDDPDVDDTPIVRFVHKILLDAINKGVSDIHMEPYEKTYRVRYRLDGILQEVVSPPNNLASKIAARLKVMSRLDISERRVPQDGRMKMRISKNRAIDFRVSTCPTLFGEKIVMRILDPASASLGIEVLGYEAAQQKLFIDAIHKPYGMVLVTGPTGSGKTVSLYTALSILNTADRNISTAEDPVEINLPGINQVNVNPRVGLTFSAALKSFLRQDPDIIMVGEIRDIETGEIAIKAAQTGHMVLSTLHTNDAPQTLTRLINMGVAPFNIASAVSLIIAQRLARRLCEHCKEPIDIPRDALLREGFKEEQLEDIQLFAPIGCDNCSKGYKGRVGIYQVMPISEAMGKLIMEGGNALQLAALAADEGVYDLRQSGLLKVKRGLTSLEEINRVITG
ncbi:Type IV fimbrial assembly, ATPase PilB [hydrothermal vent metagenome]|uniref:Type IV fimbrial assembly, ATPase PilB n=1 Tax=hydrothermal vent metagenome TaxID=652676 RepID=A0A3B0ZS98_9ZZZZ